MFWYDPLCTHQPSILILKERGLGRCGTSNLIPGYYTVLFMANTQCNLCSWKGIPKWVQLTYYVLCTDRVQTYIVYYRLCDQWIYFYDFYWSSPVHLYRWTWFFKYYYKFMSLRRISTKKDICNDYLEICQGCHLTNHHFRDLTRSAQVLALVLSQKCQPTGIRTT